jgi:ferredoxin-NADP reductase
MKKDHSPSSSKKLFASKEDQGRSYAAALLIFLVAVSSISAQVSPEEHARHHPGSGTSPGPGTPSTPQSGPMGPGMMGEMGEMMGGMHGTPPKQLYPTLMSLPLLSPEQRQKVEQQADEEMRSGTALMNRALDELAQAQAAGNFAAMHDATLKLHEGMARFDSGTAAKRALAEGKAPRDIALTWFKREMNLTPPVGEAAHGARGLSLFHFFTMALLIAFAVAMLAMYYFKMRRAAALFGRIEPDKGPPPPGSAPPLGGSPGPSSSPGGGQARTSGGSPSASATSGAASPAKLPSDTSPPTAQRVNGASSRGPPRRKLVGPPLTASWAGKLRVETIVRETPSVQTFRLRSPDRGPLPFTYQPGQFLNVAFGIGGARMIRSYSISSSPNERDYLELTIKREERGAVSRHINDLLNVGDIVEAGGPVGTFTFTGAEANSIVLISAGVGVTPMMSTARYLTERSWPGDIFFIHACRTMTDFIFREPIAALEKRNPKLRVAVMLSKAGPEWTGPRGRVTKEFLMATVPDFAARRVHICGPLPMMDATKAILREIGVPPENIKTEQFGAIKPPLGAPATTAKPTVAATGPLVTFSKNNKTANIRPNQTILELSEDLGIGIDFSCRIGVCGVCKVKMTSGEVDMAVQDALTDDDKANNIILACQAKPRTPVTVEA